MVIECKVLHKSLEATIAEGLEQTWHDMDRCGTGDGHLIIFDRRPGVAWGKRIFQRRETFQGKEIQIWGCEAL